MPILKVYDESTQSWVSIPSVQGETGAAAGFGTPTVSVDSTTGTPSATVTASGEDTAKVFSFAFSGLKGVKGDDGTTPSTTVTTITGGHNVAFSYGSGDPRNTDFNVMDGQDGSGIPAGGTTGQVLAKSSNADYAVTWANASSGGLTITITKTGSTYISDKTFTEIRTAIENKENVQLIDASSTPRVVYELHDYPENLSSGGNLYFTQVDVSAASGDSIAYGIKQTQFKIYVTSGGQMTITKQSAEMESFSVPWNLRVAYNNGSWSIQSPTRAPSPYSLCKSYANNGNAIGFLTIAKSVWLEHNDDYVFDYEQYWLSNIINGESEGEGGGWWQEDATFVFSNIKKVNGVDTLCQFTVASEQTTDSWDYFTNITYTETPIGGGGGSDKVMCVTLTYSSSIYSSDKSIDDIITAVGNGYDVFLKYGTGVYQLRECDASLKRAFFYRVNLYSNYINEYYYRLEYNTNYTNNTRVQYYNSSFMKPDVIPQYYFKVEKTGENSYELYSSNASIGYLDILNSSEFGSAYLFIGEEGSTLPYTQYTQNFTDFYSLTNYWNSEEYVEYYDEYEPFGNAVFSKIGIDNGAVKLKSFTIKQNMWDSEYTTVTYSEVSLGQAPSAQGVSF